MSKPLILVTNDDGITSPGIRNLIEAASELGTPFVVAPDSPQSGQGHAITITKPLRLREVDIFPGITAYECSGTPADCVKLAKSVLLSENDIDLCVSGINHGSNASINIIYSGTMSAAMEASIDGIKSIGFSLDDFSYKADMQASKHYAKKIMQSFLNDKNSSSSLLNVNIPKLPLEQIKGIKVCKQGKGNWSEKYLENKTPKGQPYYWLDGDFKVENEETDSDLWALKNGFVSIVPSMHDLTHYKVIEEIKHLENIKA